MKKVVTTITFILMILMAACGNQYGNPQENTLLQKEIDEGWALLFNGESLKGWTLPTPGNWEVEDASITCAGKGIMGPQGMIWTNEKYGDFILKCEFKINNECNSGIFFRVGDTNSPIQTGFEMQVIDSFANPVSGGRATHSCGALYDIVAPSHNMAKPAGEWNSAVITCKKNIISIALNGDQVVSTVDLDLYTEANQNIDASENKFTLPLKDFAKIGHIGFQQNGGRVWFRNIKIKAL